MPTLASGTRRGAMTPGPLNLLAADSVMSPLVGVSSRLMQRSSVDLPEPDAPMMQVTSPWDWR